MTEQPASENPTDAKKYVPEKLPSPPEAADSGGGATSATTDSDPAESESGRDHQAAKYRKQLRAEQAARQADNQQATERITALETQLETLRRDQVNGYVAATGMKADAFWASGVAVDDLLTDTGVIDIDKVTAAIATARDKFGITPPRRAPMSQLKSGSMPRQEPRNPWKDAFSPRRDREQ